MIRQIARAVLLYTRQMSSSLGRLCQLQDVDLTGVIPLMRSLLAMRESNGCAHDHLWRHPALRSI
jgi:hypothetical protein